MSSAAWSWGWALHVVGSCLLRRAASNECHLLTQSPGLWASKRMAVQPDVRLAVREGSACATAHAGQAAGGSVMRSAARVPLAEALPWAGRPALGGLPAPHQQGEGVPENGVGQVVGGHCALIPGARPHSHHIEPAARRGRAPDASHSPRSGIACSTRAPLLEHCYPSPACSRACGRGAAPFRRGCWWWGRCCCTRHQTRLRSERRGRTHGANASQ